MNSVKLGKKVNSVILYPNTRAFDWEKKPTAGHLAFLDMMLRNLLPTKVKVYAYVGNSKWYLYYITSMNASMMSVDVREVDFYSEDEEKMYRLRGAPGYMIEG